MQKNGTPNDTSIASKTHAGRLYDIATDESAPEAAREWLWGIFNQFASNASCLDYVNNRRIFIRAISEVLENIEVNNEPHEPEDDDYQMLKMVLGRIKRGESLADVFNNCIQKREGESFIVNTSMYDNEDYNNDDIEPGDTLFVDSDRQFQSGDFVAVRTSYYKENNIHAGVIHATGRKAKKYQYTLKLGFRTIRLTTEMLTDGTVEILGPITDVQKKPCEHRTFESLVDWPQFGVKAGDEITIRCAGRGDYRKLCAYEYRGETFIAEFKGDIGIFGFADSEGSYYKMPLEFVKMIGYAVSVTPQERTGKTKQTTHRKTQSKKPTDRERDLAELRSRLQQLIASDDDDTTQTARFRLEREIYDLEHKLDEDEWPEVIGGGQ